MNPNLRSKFFPLLLGVAWLPVSVACEQCLEGGPFGQMRVSLVAADGSAVREFSVVASAPDMEVRAQCPQPGGELPDWVRCTPGGFEFHLRGKQHPQVFFEVESPQGDFLGNATPRYQPVGPLTCDDDNGVVSVQLQ